MPSHGQKHENRRRRTSYQVSTTLSFIDANFRSSLFSPIEHQPKLCSAICPSNKCHRPSNECIIDADCGSFSSDLSTNHLLFDASFLPLFSFFFCRFENRFWSICYSWWISGNENRYKRARGKNRTRCACCGLLFFFFMCLPLSLFGIV